MPPKYTSPRELNNIDVANQVVRKYVRGEAQAVIAIDLNMPVEKVKQVIDKVKVEWLERIKQNFNDLRITELSKIDEVERVAWEAWMRSTGDEIIHSKDVERVRRLLEDTNDMPEVKGQPKLKVIDPRVKPKKTKSVMVINKEVTKTTTRGRDGNPAFLTVIQWCIQTRIKLLGLGETVEDKDNKPAVDWQQLLMPRPVRIVDVFEQRVLAETTKSEAAQSE